MLTVLEIIKRTADFLAGKGVESARLNAELLIGHALGLGRMQLYLQFERPLTAAELDRIRPLVRRRGQREPLQHIVGETDFHGLRLRTDRRALIPRPETEYLIELVIARLATPPRRILDLGTGSGAIALALARRYPEAEVVATDASAEALALARANADLNGLAARVRWVESDWFAAVAGEPFELIVSNPPYLSEAEVAEAAPEVREHEPRGALTPGGDGLGALLTILGSAGSHLAPGGLLALETGIAQHAKLVPFAAQQGWVTVETLPDLTGRERYILARAP